MNQQEQLKEFIKQGEEEFKDTFKNSSWWEDAENNKHSPAHSILSWHNQQLTLAYNLGRESVVGEITKDVEKLRKKEMKEKKIDPLYDKFIRNGLAVGFTDDQIDFLWEYVNKVANGQALSGGFLGSF